MLRSVIMNTHMSACVAVLHVTIPEKKKETYKTRHHEKKKTLPKKTRKW